MFSKNNQTLQEPSRDAKHQAAHKSCDSDHKCSQGGDAAKASASLENSVLRKIAKALFSLKRERIAFIAAGIMMPNISEAADDFCKNLYTSCRRRLPSSTDPSGITKNAPYDLHGDKYEVRNKEHMKFKTHEEALAALGGTWEEGKPIQQANKSGVVDHWPKKEEQAGSASDNTTPPGAAHVYIPPPIVTSEDDEGRPASQPGTPASPISPLSTDGFSPTSDNSGSPVSTAKSSNGAGSPSSCVSTNYCNTDTSSNGNSKQQGGSPPSDDKIMQGGNGTNGSSCKDNVQGIPPPYFKLPDITSRATTSPFKNGYYNYCENAAEEKSAEPKGSPSTCGTSTNGSSCKDSVQRIPPPYFIQNLPDVRVATGATTSHFDEKKYYNYCVETVAAEKNNNSTNDPTDLPKADSDMAKYKIQKRDMVKYRDAALSKLIQKLLRVRNKNKNFVKNHDMDGKGKQISDIVSKHTVGNTHVTEFQKFENLVDKRCTNIEPSIEQFLLLGFDHKGDEIKDTAGGENVDRTAVYKTLKELDNDNKNFNEDNWKNGINALLTTHDVILGWLKKRCSRKESNFGSFNLEKEQEFVIVRKEIQRIYTSLKHIRVNHYAMKIVLEDLESE